MRRIWAAAVIATLAAGPAALAQSTVPSEVSRIGDVQIIRYLHGFLSDEERTLLMVIATNADALETMMGGAGASGHAAMAVAPGEGLVQGGMPSASAHAIAQLPDADTARAEALAGCEAARQRGPACVVVLEVAPLR